MRPGLPLEGSAGGVQSLAVGVVNQGRVAVGHVHAIANDTESPAGNGSAIRACPPRHDPPFPAGIHKRKIHFRDENGPLRAQDRLLRIEIGSVRIRGFFHAPSDCRRASSSSTKRNRTFGFIGPSPLTGNLPQLRPRKRSHTRFHAPSRPGNEARRTRLRIRLGKESFGPGRAGPSHQ